jgi:peptidyl-prolyl cis-trans isomerase C
MKQMQWKQWLSATVACSMLATAAYAQTTETAPAAKPAAAGAAAAKVAAPVAGAVDTANPVILKVDGQSVTKSEVIASWNSMFPNGKVPDFDKMQGDVRENILRGIATEKVLMKKALDAKMDDDADVKARIEQLKGKVMLQVFLEKQAAARVSDADIHKRLDAENAKLKDKKQARARHILVKTKAEAEGILAKLKSGSKFDELAKKLSLDKTSGEKGGELGFFGADDMVPEFSKVVFAMKAGDISVPVETSFGWHIIKLEEVRPVPPVAFDTVKDQYAEELRSKALEQYVGEVVSKSEIREVSPDGKEKVLSNAADPAASAPAAAAAAPAEAAPAKAPVAE